MPSPAFLMARFLSPQTTAGKEYSIPGGIATITREDLNCATSYIGDAVAWMAVDAKWLGGRKSCDGLLQLTEAESWRCWQTSNLKRVCEIRQGMMLNWLMAELAFLDWMNPDRTHSERGGADFLSQYEHELKVTRHAYRTHYKRHVDELANWLQDKEQRGLSGVSAYLREAA